MSTCARCGYELPDGKQDREICETCEAEMVALEKECPVHGAGAQPLQPWKLEWIEGGCHCPRNRVEGTEHLFAASVRREGHGRLEIDLYGHDRASEASLSFVLEDATARDLAERILRALDESQEAGGTSAP